MQNFSSKLRHTSGDSLEQRLVRYGAMAAAVALGGGTAEAAIIYHVAPDGSTTTGNTGIQFDLINGNVSVASNSENRAAGANLPSFGALFVLRGGFNPFSSYSASVYENVAGPSATGGVRGLAVFTSSSFTDYRPADRLAASDNVGPGDSFGGFASLASTSSSRGNFLPGSVGTRGFIGLRFSFDGGLNRNFGWADITVNPDFTVTLHSFAFEACANESIHVGDTSGGATCSTAPVPEPHSAALVALGAAGLLAYRRRRKLAA